VIKVSILGTGSIGHTLGAVLGSRPEFQVKLWGRKVQRRVSLVIRCLGPQAVYAVGRVFSEPSLRRAVADAEVVILAVPAHVRHRILSRIAGELRHCTLLLAWEGMGRFAESIAKLRIKTPMCVGLQRSSVICRTSTQWRSVELIGVRSNVVAATIDPGYRMQAISLFQEIFPFHFTFAPTYECVSLSSANPLIHPARLYSLACSGKHLGKSIGFYAEWDDAASEVLLSLHRELARLRDALCLPGRFVRTLADGPAPPVAAQITHDLRSERSMAYVRVPVCTGAGGMQLDFAHRFFQEDIGEGLRYILSMARRAGVSMPVSKTIHAWYVHNRRRMIKDA